MHRFLTRLGSLSQSENLPPSLSTSQQQLTTEDLLYSELGKEAFPENLINPLSKVVRNIRLQINDKSYVSHHCRRFL